ncbi:MAG: SIS domain-containing protein [Methanomicrobiales archaeon]|nr:SIS domain-containing protein [Methanomicrobiales archaeon]
MQRMGEAILSIAGGLNPAQADAFLKDLLEKRRIYVAGAGRSGLIARAFGMRLMHLGFDAYVVGETITPSFHESDLLVVFSGSGETQSVVSIARAAKEIGGKVCLVTSMPDSRMHRLADTVVQLGDLSDHYERDQASFEVRQLTGKYRSVSSAFAPLGTMFETLALVFSDAVISSLMDMRSEEIPKIRERLTNLE